VGVDGPNAPSPSAKPVPNPPVAEPKFVDGLPCKDSPGVNGG
jgi:hypothetical protein